MKRKWSEVFLNFQHPNYFSLPKIFVLFLFSVFIDLLIMASGTKSANGHFPLISPAFATLFQDYLWQTESFFFLKVFVKIPQKMIHTPYFYEAKNVWTTRKKISLISSKSRASSLIFSDHFSNSLIVQTGSLLCNK